jgi:hypothetical protein
MTRFATCGLPSCLDIDPSTLTDDPLELAALERAMAQLIGMKDPKTPPPRRVASHAPRPTRLQGDDRADRRGQTLGETAVHV